MMDPMVGSCASKVPMLLVALAAGYGVLVLSQQQQRPVSGLGRFLGAVILLVSFAGLLCTAVCTVRSRWGKCHDAAQQCGMSMKHCPVSAPTEAPAEPK
jgi:hypothetical protein